MDCSIINKKVQLHLQETDMSLGMMLEAASHVAAQDDHDIPRIGASHFRTALQNPEVRRAELAAMLRRAVKKQQSEKSQRTYWTIFMNSYVRGNANSNEFFE